MKHEVFCKFLAHTLCCLILERCERGIEAAFRKEEKEAARPALMVVPAMV